MGQHVSSPAPGSANSNYERYKADAIFADKKIYDLLSMHLAQSSPFIAFFNDLRTELHMAIPGGVQFTLHYIADMKYKAHLKLNSFVPELVDGQIRLPFVDDLPFYLFFACLLDRYNEGLVLSKMKILGVTIYQEGMSESVMNRAGTILGFVRDCFPALQLSFERMAYITPVILREGYPLAKTIRKEMSEYVWMLSEHWAQERIYNWENYYKNYGPGEDSGPDASPGTVSVSGGYADNSDVTPRILAADSEIGSHVSSNQQGFAGDNSSGIDWERQIIDGVHIDDQVEFVEKALHKIEISSAATRIPNPNDNNRRGGAGDLSPASPAPPAVEERLFDLEGFLEIDRVMNPNYGSVVVPVRLIHVGVYATPTPGKYMILSTYLPLVQSTFEVYWGAGDLSPAVVKRSGPFVRQMQGNYNRGLVEKRVYTTEPSTMPQNFTEKIGSMDARAFVERF